MIYIIAGEDIVSSRKKLSEFLTNSQNIVHLDGKKQTFGEIDTSLVSDSLFSEKKAIVIERFTKVTPQKDFFEKILKFEKDPDIEIFLWEGNELTPKFKSLLKTAKNFSFSFPKPYYEFLDGFSPKTSSVKIFHEVLKTFEAEQALYGLIRRIRQLLVLKFDSNSNFPEFKTMQPWQIGKIEKQAKLWSEEDLSVAFIKLTELDEKMKTGALTMSLSKHIDILLLRA